MSRPPAVACEGAPRDLGLDQGRFARHQVAQALREVPHPGFLDRWFPDPHEPAVRTGRDLRRYFPHMAERTTGLARGARVREQALWQLLRDSVGERSGATLAAAGCVVRAVDAPSADLLVRRSAPGEDFRSIELVLPGLVPALAGVNEHGLVVVGSWTASPGVEDTEPCRAPGLLLVQDCLQRFRGVGAAVEWCERRPAGGETTIVLADATGALAAVHVTPQVRQVVEPRDGLLVAPFATERAEALRKEVASATRLDAATLAAALLTGGEAGAVRIHLEPGVPRLGVQGAGDGSPEWIELLPGEGRSV